MQGARDARTATPLRPEWGLCIEPPSPGYAIVATHRSWAPLTRSAMILLPTLLVLGGSSQTGLLSSPRETGAICCKQVLAGLLGVVILALVWKLGQGVRDNFSPGTVRVTERGVSYRGSSMAFEEIEEVTANVPIEVVGDRRFLRLAVARELTRLIIEVAPRAPRGI